MTESFDINGTIIPPGEQALVKLPIGRLPSGNQITIHTYVFRATQPGPVLLVLGGLHGDEINGIEIVRQSMEMQLFSNLQCGSVIAIPLLNVFGFINFSREGVDGKDVNRSFPGSMTGSLSSRVARSLTRHILPLVSMGVDFHTGGQSRFNFPQVRFTTQQPSAVAFAEIFNPPLRIVKSTIGKSLRRIGLNMGIPILVYEGGESLRIDEHGIQQGIRGIKRLLNHHEMNSFIIPDQDSILLSRSSWIRANQAGLFYPAVSNGSRITKGQLVGWIHEPIGSNNSPVVSKYNGYIYCVNNKPVVYPGEPLMNIGML